MSRSPDIAVYPQEIMHHYSERHWDWLAYWSVRPLIDLTRVKLVGHDSHHLYEVADSGAPTFIFSNHISWADHFLIYYFAIKDKPYRCSAIAKEKYYKWIGAREVLRWQNTIPITNIKITFARWYRETADRPPSESDFVAFMEEHGGDPAHPVNQRKAEAMARLVDDTKAMLERGRLILAYPEGTRSKDGRLQATKTGIMQLPLMLKGTIVPTGVMGTDKILGRDNRWHDFLKFFLWKGPRIECRFGPGLRWDEALTMVEQKFERREDPLDLARVRDLRAEIEAGTFRAFTPEAARYERIFDEVALLTMRRINALLPAQYQAAEAVEVKYSRAL